MLNQILQQEVPVVAIVAGLAAAFMLKKSATYLKTVNGSKSVFGAIMLLMGLTGMGVSHGELGLKDEVEKPKPAVLAAYEGLEEKATPEIVPLNHRYVPNQVATGIFALGLGLTVCGVATSVRHFSNT